MILKTKAEGTATLTTTATYKQQTLTNTENITVTQNLNLKTPQHSRDTGYGGNYAITGVKIINPISSIEVGREYVLIGYVIPAYWLQDNLVEFTSSDPDVASVTFGVLKGNSTGTATITCKAIGTNYTDSFTVTVAAATETTYESSEIYQMAAPAATDATTVTLWFRDAIAAASAGGYKKLLFPEGEGTYYMTPEAILGSDTSVGTSIDRTCLYIPSNLCVDLNGCTIQINKSVWSTYNTGTGSQGGYTFICFGNSSAYCENSSIINGTISGEVNQLPTITSGNEHTRSIHLCNAYNCEIRGLELCNSPGFNAGTSCGSIGGIGDAVYFKHDDGLCEAGGFDDSGQPRNEPMSWRTTDSWLTSWKSKFQTMIANKAKSKYYQIGSVWGKTAEFCDTTTYDILWYNSSDELILVSRNQMVYYSYEFPEGASYAKLVLHQDGKPTGSNGFQSYCFAPLFQVSEAINCRIVSCNIHNNTSTGVALTGGQHCSVRGCTFANNGYRDPSSHIDMEDNGDTMHGTIIAGNNFSTYQGYVKFVKGRNVAIHSNSFSCYTDAGRAYGFRIYGNSFWSSNGGPFAYSGDCVYAYNYAVKGGGYKPSPRNKRTDRYPGYYNFFSFDNFDSDGNPANPGTSLLKTGGTT